VWCGVLAERAGREHAYVKQAEVRGAGAWLRWPARRE
jgi:hypothetical protein